MSSDRKWAKNEISVTKKNVTHDATSITKASSIKIGLSDDQITAKIGIRIKAGQDVDLFEIKPSGSSTPIPLTKITNHSDPRYGDVNLVLPPGNDDQWVLYTAPWKLSYGKAFVTTIRLKPNNVHDNGFQVVTVVATADGVSLATGHYIYGVSIIPGATNEREPSLGSVFAKPYAAAKGTRAASKKASKKTPKRARASKKTKKK